MTTLAAVAILTFGYCCYEAARMGRLSTTSKKLARIARPFEKAGRPESLLVVGDSTGVGVGAAIPEESVAGRVSTSLGVGVENHARSGALTKAVLGQLAQARRERYDLVLIQTGGNDVMRFRSLRKAQRSLEQAITAAKRISDRVFVMTSGRIGRAPFFPYILVRQILTARSYTLRERFARSCTQLGATYVDLIPSSVVFNTDPSCYYSRDLLHPSSEGYRLWAEELLRAIKARTNNPMQMPTTSARNGTT